MVTFLKDRYFNYDFHKSSDRPGSVFAAGSHWVSFSRLAPHIIAVLDTRFGPRASWPDSMATLMRELMRGEHDKECVRLCVQLPANLDLTPAVMQKRLTEMFVPLARALRSLLEQAALENADMQQKKPLQDDTTTPGALVANGAIDESAVGDGDVTDVLASQASLKEKVGIVNQLNKDAKLKREKDTRRLVLDACMQLLRSRVVVCANTELLKCYMESQQAGLVARTVIVDGTMIASRQSGDKSRSMCLAMTKSVQEDLAKGIKILPATPVVGNVLIRSGNHSVDILEKHLQNTHSHRLHCVVPVVVAEKEMRFIRSGIRRANGPTDDEASGIDFIQRTIGKRRVNEETGDALDDEVLDDGASEASGASAAGEDQDDVGAGDAGDAEQSTLDRAFSEMTDPALMPAKVLKELFGARANDIKSILFQHTTRIGTPAEYLAKAGFFQWRKSEMSHYRKYRKGQVHPSVYISVLSGVLASSNVPLTTNEILVDITGGTPEVMVAGIVLGFKKVAFIAEGVEEVMMSIPTMDDQRVHSLNYDECPLNPG
jgi:hypothetical protein